MSTNKVKVVLSEEPETKKSSKWIEHVKEYSKQNNISYKESLKSEKCKSSYKK